MAYLPHLFHHKLHICLPQLLFQIEFVVYLNSKKQFLPPPSDEAGKDLTSKDIEKVAIIPLKMESCCDNEPSIIKGFDSLKQRHLEILGYKVAHINHRMWNSMYLSLPGARLDYVKQVIGVS